MKRSIVSSLVILIFAIVVMTSASNARIESVFAESDSHLVVEKTMQQGSPVDALLNSCSTQHFPFVFLNVSVEESGAPITDLSAGNFECSENGVLQTDLFSVTPPLSGGGVRLADIVFLIDTSGSMGGEIAAVRDNVVTFAQSLSSSDVDFRLGLVQFGNSSGSNPGVFDGGVLTSDVLHFQTLVASLSATGTYEPGFLAIRMAVQSFDFRPGAQKIFILISDEDSDDRDKQSTIDLLTINDVTVHTAVSCSAGTSQSDYCDETSIRGATGGLLFNVVGPYDQILDTIVAQTATSYVLRYRSDNQNFDGTTRNVTCTVTTPNGSDSVSCTYIPGAEPKIELTSETEALNEAPLAEGSTPAISVRVTDQGEPFVQSVTLYYRTSGTGNIFSAMPMNTVNTDIYEAILPAVSSPGIDYYIRATDGQVTSSLPSTDPGVSPFQIAVLPNVAPDITHTPVPIATGDSPLALEALVTDTTNSLDAVELRWRRVGELLYQSLSMSESTPGRFSATIPGNEMTSDIQYYIWATDDLGVATNLGSPDNPLAIQIIRSVDASFRTNPHGYDFPNYGGFYPLPPALFDFTNTDTVRMFGNEDTCAHIIGDLCILSFGAAMWNESANLAMNGGHCDGMTSTSLRFFMGIDNPSSFQSGANTTHDLDQNNIRQHIAYNFVLQMANPVAAAKATSVQNSPNQILFQLYEAMQDGTDPVNLVVRRLDPRSGHSILPYAILDQGNGIYHVLVYDNNHPNDDGRFVEFDTRANGWSYNLGNSIWSGDETTHTIGIAPLSVYLQQPECPWCDPSLQQIMIDRQDSNVMSQTWINGDALALVTDELGRRIGYLEDQLINEIPNAFDMEPATGLGEATPPILYIPGQNELQIQVRANNTDNSAPVLVNHFGGGWAAEVGNLAVTETTAEKFSLAEDGAEISFEAGSSQELQLTLVSDKNESWKFRAIDVSVAPAENVSISHDSAAGQYFLNRSQAAGDQYSIEIGKIDESGENSFIHSNISIASGDTHIFAVGAWNPADPITLCTDQGSDGSIDDCVDIENEAPGSGTITINKDAGGDTVQEFSFAGSLGQFTLADGDSKIVSDLSTGEYEITESKLDGWLLETVDCGTADTSKIENGVKIMLGDGEDVTCTFHNVNNQYDANIFMPVISSQ